MTRSHTAQQLPSFSQDELNSFMSKALDQAALAAQLQEVPIGAVLVSINEKKIIAADHNRTETLSDPSAHAEVLVIRQLAAVQKNWRLDNAALFVTAEPCTMCAGTILQARIPLVVFGCVEPVSGAVGSCYDLLSSRNIRIIQGVLEDSCKNILQDFFKARRL
jgi:tRNA(adenine34) deaminase